MNSAQRSNDLTIEVVVIPVTYIDRVNHVTDAAASIRTARRSHNCSRTRTSPNVRGETSAPPAAQDQDRSTSITA